ncbi:MAG TPA: SUMF1/EgtB/PvdO family nonheme iron enzyme [Woeseiaceae bacterium]|nr:SUMF1/EgtB/PvdO family nonheme iron enzyme [Woeseiaceae bacterium]
MATVKIGDWVVDRDTNSIRRDTAIRQLQPLSINILLYLAEHTDRVVTSNELIEKFWPRRIVGDDAVHRRIADLRKMLEDNAKEPKYIRTISKRGYRLIADVQQGETTVARKSTRHWVGAKTLIVVVLGIVLLAAIQWQRVASHRSAVAAAFSRAESFLEKDEYQAAYIELLPFLGDADVAIQGLLEKIVVPVSIHTNPPGVDVAYRFESVDSEWTPLGVTPLTDLALPRGHYKLRFGDALFMDATNPGVTLNSAGRDQRTIDLPLEPVPDGMVYIPAGKYRLGAWGFLDEFDLGGFFIDKFEVSNRDFQEFVDAGGYQDPAYWQDLIDASAGTLSWPIIRDNFVDLTGRPGPAHWEVGTFPSGDAALPVVGVSWYEANAYLRFRDKRLPSIHHWLRATLGPMEWKYPFAPALVPRSNVGSGQLMPVDRQSDAEVNGTYDMIGNAAEWTLSGSDSVAATIGSSAHDPTWAYNFPQPLDALQRPETVGFRGMRTSVTSVPDPLPKFQLFNDFSHSIRQVSDEKFAGMKLSFDYRAGTIDAKNVVVVSEQAFENWTRREVLVPTGRPDDPLPVVLYIPRRFGPPYQSVIYLPPADSWSPGFRTDSIVIENYQIDFVPRSGRVLIWPVYTGTHERYNDYHADSGPERASLALERNRRVRDEVGRVIDYLETAADFDGEKVALMALSFGATLAPFILATEPRIDASIIYSAGIAPPIPVFANLQNDPNIFWARVQQPTLLVNGRYDPIRPHRFVLSPLLDLLATEPESKQIILYESAHWPLPRYLMMRDSLDWLDRYLGPPAP